MVEQQNGINGVVEIKNKSLQLLLLFDEDNWQSHVYPPSTELMDRWGIGVGGPQALPEPVPDTGLFQAAEL